MGLGSRDTTDRQPIVDHYAGATEVERLDRPRGRLEWERTREVLGRWMPPPPAVVAAIGGGPGRYALWLAQLGYRVRHRDLLPKHVEQLRALMDNSQASAIETGVADACDLADLPDHSVDAVLLLGPLYHLRTRPERLQAWREVRRIAKPGALVFGAAISRWSARLDAYIGQKLYASFPRTTEQLPAIERTGWIPPLVPGGFTAYTHRPRQLWAEARAVGLEPLTLVGIEGVGYLLSDLEGRWQDPTARAALLESAQALEAVPELMGASPHILLVARACP